MLPRILLPAFLLGLGLTLASCGGGDDHPRHHNREAMGGARSTPRQVMHGTQSFFAGKIIVEAKLSEGSRHGGPGGPDAGEPPSESGGDDESAGGGGGGRHHGHRGGGGGAGGYLGGGGMTESNLPPVTLRLHISNTSDGPIEITFNGCDSALGNFVVMPEKLTIPAGQSVEPDPMRSLLGIPSDQVPIELSIAMPGKSEKKTVTLQLDQPAATMSEAPAPGTVPVPAPPPSVP